MHITKSQHWNDTSVSLSHNKVYDISFSEVKSVKDVRLDNHLIYPIEENGRKRIPIKSTILSTCYNIFYGDFTSFCGPMGSGRTTNAFESLKLFVHQN